MSSPAPGEVVDFEITKDCDWMELRLSNGAVLKLKVSPTAVVYAGNDPNTGLPIFTIQMGAIVRLGKVPPEMLRRSPPSGAYK